MIDVLKGLLIAIVLIVACFWIGVRYGDFLFGSWLPDAIRFMKATP